MADTATPAGQGGGQSQTASPAPSSNGKQTQTTVSGVSTVGVSKDASASFLDGLGIRARNYREDTAPAIDQQSASADEPAQDAGHTDGAEAAEAHAVKDGADTTTDTTEAETQSATGEEIEVPADLLKEFASLDIQAEQEAKSESQTNVTPEASTPEEFEKIVNPNGNASLEEYRKQAQSFFGRQGTQIHQLKQANQKLQDAWQKVGGVFEFDPKTGQAKATPKAVLDIAGMVDKAEMDKALADQGMKLVPVDYEDQLDPLKAREKDIADVLNELIPGDELSHDEKLAEVDGDPKKRLSFIDKLTERRAARQAKIDAQTRQRDHTRQQEALAQQAYRQQMEQKTVELFSSVEKLPYGKELKAKMLLANKQLPPEIRGNLRLQLIYKLGRSALFGSYDVPRIYRQAVESVRKQSNSNNRLAGAMASGEKPIHIPGGNGNGADGEAENLRRGLLGAVGIRRR